MPDYTVEVRYDEDDMPYMVIVEYTGKKEEE